MIGSGSDSGSAGRIDPFLFAPVDARVAAAMRIALAGMIAWAFWSVGLRPTWPVTMIPGAAGWYERVFTTSWYAGAVMVPLVLFASGWQARAAGLVLLVMLVPLASLTRGQQSRHVLLAALLVFSMLRSDARWSIRAWLAGDSGRIAQAFAGPIWPIRLLQAQLSIIYGINALAKATPQYLSGDVLVGMARMHPNFLVDLSDNALNVGRIGVPIAVAAAASVLIEAYLAVGFWIPRLRWPTAAVGVLFHLGLQQIVRIFMLDYVTMFLYLAFLLPWRRGEMPAPAAERDVTERAVA